MINKAFPLVSSHATILKISLGVGLFVFLFLLVFQPFGLASIPGNKFIFIAGYGIISFVITGLVTFLNGSLFKEQHWTLFNQIMYYLVLITVISLANFYYTQTIIHSFDFSPLKFVLYTLSVGIFPTFFITVLHEKLLNKNYILESDKVNLALQSANDGLKEISDEFSLKSTQGISITIKQSNILFIESDGNYLQIHYLKDDLANISKFRGTIKSVLTKLNPTFRKTHRAYIVNKRYIQQAKGNAQGLTLTIMHTKKQVPVSRSFVQEFKRFMES